MHNNDDLLSDMDELSLDDELWDDEEIENLEHSALDTAEETLAVQTKNKTSKKPPILALFIIGAAGLGAFYYVSQIMNAEQALPPIVKIEQAAPDTVQSARTHTDFNSQSPETALISDPASPHLESSAPEQDVSTSPLIPLPDETQIQNAVLANLDIESETEDATIAETDMQLSSEGTQQITDILKDSPIENAPLKNPEESLIDEEALLSITDKQPVKDDVREYNPEPDTAPNEVVQPPKSVTPQNQEAQSEIESEALVAPAPQDTRTTATTAADAKPTKNTEASKPSEPSIIWTIKAAQPGKAVIYDRASGATKSIEIDDFVPSLGRILSISNASGTWVIKGSKRSIKN